MKKVPKASSSLNIGKSKSILGKSTFNDKSKPKQTNEIKEENEKNPKNLKLEHKIPAKKKKVLRTNSMRVVRPETAVPQFPTAEEDVDKRQSDKISGHICTEGDETPTKVEPGQQLELVIKGSSRRLLFTEDGKSCQFLPRTPQREIIKKETDKGYSKMIDELADMKIENTMLKENFEKLKEKCSLCKCQDPNYQNEEADRFQEMLSKKDKIIQELSELVDSLKKSQEYIALESQEKEKYISTLLDSNIHLEEYKEKNAKLEEKCAKLKIKKKALINKYNKFMMELKKIKQDMLSLPKESLSTQDNSTIIKNLKQKLLEETERANQALLENNRLREAIIYEQSRRIETSKDILELEERLELSELRVRESDEIRYQLAIDIQTLQGNIQRLSRRIEEGQTLFTFCTNYFKEQGLQPEEILSSAALIN